MKGKPYIRKSLKYLLYTLGAFFVGSFAGILFKYPIEMVFRPSLMTERIIDGCCLSIPPAFLLYVTVKRSAYKSVSFRLADVLITASSALLIQQVLASLIGYVFWTAGGAGLFADAICLRNTEIASPEQAETLRVIERVVMLALDVAVYLPVIIAGEYFGAKRRLQNRKEVIGA